MNTIMSCHIRWSTYTKSVNDYHLNAHSHTWYILNDFLQPNHVHACRFLLFTTALDAVRLAFSLLLWDLFVITSVLLTSNLDISIMISRKSKKIKKWMKKACFIYKVGFCLHVKKKDSLINQSWAVHWPFFWSYTHMILSLFKLTIEM